MELVTDSQGTLLHFPILDQCILTTGHIFELVTPVCVLEYFVIITLSKICTFHFGILLYN
jgi:hypothetical protein